MARAPDTSRPLHLEPPPRGAGRGGVLDPQGDAQELHAPAPACVAADRPWSADLRAAGPGGGANDTVDDTVTGGPAADDGAPSFDEATMYLDTEDDDPPARGRAMPPRATDAPAVPGAARRNEESHGVHAPAQDPGFPQIPGLRVERLVHEGPCGRLFDARDLASRRPVHVRLLPGALQRVEADRLDSLRLARHPNLFGVLKFAVCRDGPYLVVEREEGETARAWVRRIGPLPERIALSVVLEAARGLRHAEFHGAVHGDLSPDAVMIDRAGQVRVRGVGMRKLLAPVGDAPMAPDFAAPERRAGAPPSFRGDLWSLGALLQFLLTGAPPDPDEDAARTLEARGVEVSPATSELLARLLAADPDARPGTWDLLLVELERRVPAAAQTTSSAGDPALDGGHRRRLWTIAAACAALVALGALLRFAAG